MKEHNWMLQTVTAGIKDTLWEEDFWVCGDCRCCGGIYISGHTKPIHKGNLTGTPLFGLPDDCDEAKKIIEEFLLKHPDWASTADKHRLYSAPLKPFDKQAIIEWPKDPATT